MMSMAQTNSDCVRWMREMVAKYSLTLPSEIYDHLLKERKIKKCSCSEEDIREFAYGRLESQAC